MKLVLTLTFLLTLSQSNFAQESLWTLKRCIAYALENNITIQYTELEIHQKVIDRNNAKLNRLPSVHFSSNSGLNFGRSISPTTNQFENTQFTYFGLNLNSNVLLFGWFEKKYSIQKNTLLLLQSQENYKVVQNDIALNISTAYLRALLALEQIQNDLYQIELSKNSKFRIQNLLEQGKSNVLELSQSETQLASDSSLFFQAKLNYEQAIIDLKTLLNLDYNCAFFIDTNIRENIFFQNSIDKENVYSTAMNNFHSIRKATYDLQIAEMDLKIAKANTLPKLALSYSTGTNYSSSYFETLPSGEKQLMNFGKQLNTNFSHSVGVGLSIPVFNNFSSRDNIKSLEINLQKLQISNLEIRQKLKQDIYTACTDYELTLQKYYNAQSVLNHSQKNYEVAYLRYDTGFISFYELLNEKYNFFISQNEATALKYELWFKKILIENYMNGGLVNGYKLD